MRKVTIQDSRKYGCTYCKYGKGYNKTFCRLDSCPYSEMLDRYGSYENYLQITKNKCKALLKFMGD